MRNLHPVLFGFFTIYFRRASDAVVPAIVSLRPVHYDYFSAGAVEPFFMACKLDPLSVTFRHDLTCDSRSMDESRGHLLRQANGLGPHSVLLQRVVLYDVSEESRPAPPVRTVTTHPRLLRKTSVQTSTLNIARTKLHHGLPVESPSFQIIYAVLRPCLITKNGVEMCGEIVMAGT